MKDISTLPATVPAETKNKLAEILPTVLQKLQGLEQALLAKDPGMPMYLRDSHRLLISYPESVHLLDDGEISLLLRSAEQWTDTKILAEVAKGKSGNKKTKVTADDL